jgi:threonine/homoserine/homoserine lactone efflux protein
MNGLSSATILNGLVLGWSVAWPPGPINAEMVRRALLPRAQSGGFWAAWQLGLGACTGDFIWALAVAAGAGALLSSPGLHTALGVISFGLLLCLAFVFARGAWRVAHEARAAPIESESLSRAQRSTSRGYLLGLILALTSPWNIGFWFAVIGGQRSALAQGNFLNSLTLAGAVVSGAIAWTIVLCVTLTLGARIFARPAWQVATQALSALVMLFFAARLAWQLR